ncbi:MAG: hypothetical protein KA968_09175, partial [Chitinophagaceae bacterium]|nr:hypothetical protein [Chitinophagaceae bacterium]
MMFKKINAFVIAGSVAALFCLESKAQLPPSKIGFDTIVTKTDEGQSEILNKRVAELEEVLKQKNNSTTKQPQTSTSFITDSLDKYIERGMRQWQIPGLAISIVKDGKVIVRKGYGI